MLSLEGKQLGNYDVIRRIRAGGMGAVYEGRQRTAFDRRVAIKVILGDYATDKDMRRRFAREAKTVARLHHPHILQLIEFGDEQGILYLVMPFIEGGTLTSYLRRNLPELGEVSAIYQQLLDAVEYAHEQGLIHRDIKSSNVMLELRRNAAPYIYLGDFGLVRTMRPDQATRVGKPIPLDQVPGTPHYMAPEQTLGIITPSIDIYALGVLLYQMLTGNLPYNDPDEVRVIQMHLHDPIPLPSTHDASLPAELDDVVRKAMAKRPEDRYRTVGELRRAFLAAVQGSTGSTGVVIPEEPETVQGAPEVRYTHRSTTVLHRSAETPQPILMEPSDMSNINDDSTVAVHHAHNAHAVREVPVERIERPRTTDADSRAAIKLRPLKTDEAIQKRSKRKVAVFPLIAILVSLALILLLLAPRLVRLNIPGILPFSSSNDAVVTINVHNENLQNTFLLTASAQTTKANLKDHTIPDRILTVAQSSTTSVATTGVQSTPGVQAEGNLIVTNSSNDPIVLVKGQQFFTATNIGFQSLNAVTIPARQSELVVTVANQVGANGNIAANTLSGNCCNNKALTIDNPQAFSGGSDPQTTHFVSQADLDGVSNTQVPLLEEQAKAQLPKHLISGEVMGGKTTYKTLNTTSDVPVNKAANQVRVTVQVSASVPVYKKSDVTNMAVALLNQQAQKNLNANYHPQGQPTTVGTPTVTEGNKGQLFLNVTVKGTWTYTFSDAQIQQIREAIKGDSTTSAQDYLKQQPGVGNVSIQLPFGTHQLPTNSDDITVAVAPGS
jgi:serine/threonine protein kinase